MGILDSIKNLFKGKKPQMKDGVDKGADVATDKLGAQHADKIDQGADMAKDGIDKLPD